jgi:hypothetical protein
MFVLINLTLIRFSKTRKKLLLLPYFQRTSGVAASRFLNGSAKVSAFIYSTNFFLQQSGEKFDNQRCLKSCLFGNGGQKYNLNGFR